MMPSSESSTPDFLSIALGKMISSWKTHWTYFPRAWLMQLFQF